MDNIPQDSQSAKLNKCAAQRRYRKKEGQSFLQLREALKEVSKDDPRSKQDILKRASRELRRLADENILLLQQKALLEAWSIGGYGTGHLEPMPDEDALLGMQWWLHDTTKMGDITRSDVARHRVLAGTIPPDVDTAFTAPEHENCVTYYRELKTRVECPSAGHAGRAQALRAWKFKEAGFSENLHIL